MRLTLNPSLVITVFRIREMKEIANTETFIVANYLGMLEVKNTASIFIDVVAPKRPRALHKLTHLPSRDPYDTHGY